MNIFTRKELIATFSMAEQAKIRGILSANNIAYTIKTVNRKSPSPISAGSRAAAGTLGENLQAELEYIFYVSKEQYEEAKHLI
ncbi:MAG TPA: hypothetical protein IAC82_11840 [Candidatus Merdivicinus intestinigallinarum]|nr:hypothetical protein [Candidatus Merdivicinus intestinigallinarum]